ncbi:MAG TPA: hypothetical protein VMZ30_04295 [Pyrinomonadaceae bacterium]|nr:hypothetical protein [Pyrinomonadaceae bacterium]
MADQNARNQNPGNTEDRDRQDKGQAMGAGASRGPQGQQGRQNLGGASQPNETAGQGGGMQGTGQQQSNPGGYTSGQGSARDEGQRGDQDSERKGQFGQGQNR